MSNNEYEEEILRKIVSLCSIKTNKIAIWQKNAGMNLFFQWQNTFNFIFQGKCKFGCFAESILAWAFNNP